METREQTGFFIGEWQVSPHEGTLSQDGNTVRLEPRAMEVLVYLASRPGEVVSRSDLENKVWTGMLVTDDAVTSAIIKLRKALGDNAKNPRFIATVPKRGYQLIAPVTKPAAGTDEVAVVDQAGMTVASLRADRAKVALMVTALAVVAALAWAFLSSIAPAPPESAAPALDETTGRAPSILVLPFENLSEDPAQEQFADGITEDIITDLSSLSRLRVMGNNTSFSYKGRSVRPQEVGAELDVDFVLEGEHPTARRNHPH